MAPTKSFIVQFQAHQTFHCSTLNFVIQPNRIYVATRGKMVVRVFKSKHMRMKTSVSLKPWVQYKGRWEVRPVRREERVYTPTRM